MTYEDESEKLNASTSGNESNSSILKVCMNFNKRKMHLGSVLAGHFQKLTDR